MGCGEKYEQSKDNVMGYKMAGNEDQKQILSVSQI